MDAFVVAAWSLPILILFIFIGVPVGLAMLVIGAIGSWAVFGNLSPFMSQLKTLAYTQFSSPSLAIIPLFLMMGQLASIGGLSQDIFRAAQAFLGGRKGGLGIAAIAASAGFGSICGSSVATVATVGQVAMPELKKAGYSKPLASAVLSAGGTLGILIPPSTLLILYAVMTEQNIAKLFLAAFIPGIMAAICYMIVVSLYVRVSPKSAGSYEHVETENKLKLLFSVWPVFAIFLIVIGGIYSGIFTPTEAAAVGVVTTAVAAYFKGGLTRDNVKIAFEKTAVASAMLFMIVIGAAAFNSFLAVSQLPQTLASMVLSAEISPMILLVGILIFYLILGCAMDSMSMVLLTVPVFYPMVAVMDFGMSPEHLAIWFGILVLVVVEIGLITPPVGMNLFVIKSMDKDLSVKDVYSGIWPFVTMDFVRVVFLILFPSITLFLL